MQINEPYVSKHWSRKQPKKQHSYLKELLMCNNFTNQRVTISSTDTTIFKMTFTVSRAFLGGIEFWADVVSKVSIFLAYSDNCYINWHHWYFNSFFLYVAIDGRIVIDWKKSVFSEILYRLIVITVLISYVSAHIVVNVCSWRLLLHDIPFPGPRVWGSSGNLFLSGDHVCWSHVHPGGYWTPLGEKSRLYSPLIVFL